MPLSRAVSAVGLLASVTLALVATAGTSPEADSPAHRAVAPGVSAPMTAGSHPTAAT